MNAKLFVTEKYSYECHGQIGICDPYIILPANFFGICNQDGWLLAANLMIFATKIR